MSPCSVLAPTLTGQPGSHSGAPSSCVALAAWTGALKVRVGNPGSGTRRSLGRSTQSPSNASFSRPWHPEISVEPPGRWGGEQQQPSLWPVGVYSPWHNELD